MRLHWPILKPNVSLEISEYSCKEYLNDAGDSPKQFKDLMSKLNSIILISLKLTSSVHPLNIPLRHDGWKMLLAIQVIG
jgi:hypothetical protein